ncbi:MAG: hypothetical protein Q4G35_03220 [Propionibacteriaceae bacterium]|nr:hypothetical protein [Propionibacteriaceae bacterium]
MIDFDDALQPPPPPPEPRYVYRTAVVVLRSPLWIRLETEVTHLTITPISLVDPATLNVGDRVEVRWTFTPGHSSGAITVVGKIWN